MLLSHHAFKHSEVSNHAIGQQLRSGGNRALARLRLDGQVVVDIYARDALGLPSDGVADSSGIIDRVSSVSGPRESPRKLEASESYILASVATIVIGKRWGHSKQMNW
jgi:hypothetical protein